VSGLKIFRACFSRATPVLAGLLGYLTADVATRGLVATAEARTCRSPGPAPRWARLASRMSERDRLAMTAAVIAAHRVATRERVLPPLARLLGGVACRAAFADLVRRPRPPETWWRSEPEGWSFPSRHTTHAVLMAGTLLDELAVLPPTASGAVVVGVGALVGASRVRLGVHWPSDVVAGALSGAVWLRLTRWTVRTGRRRAV
jgi:membrane-associated phospholipid phosphatase